MADFIAVQSLDHLVLSVADIGVTQAFYVRILGMIPEDFRPAGGPADGSVRKSLKFGSQKINLHQATAPFFPHAAHPVPGSADLCFLSETPLAAWQTHLETNRVGVEMGPVQRTGATGVIMSLYFRDPDGNLIEVCNRT